MESELESYSEWLIEEVQSFAALRARHARSCPDDPKTLRSSIALKTLADNLREFPANHPKNQELWELFLCPNLLPARARKICGLDLIAAVSNNLERYGYDRSDSGDAEAFLDSLRSELNLVFGGAFRASQQGMQYSNSLNRNLSIDKPY